MRPNGNSSVASTYFDERIQIPDAASVCILSHFWAKKKDVYQSVIQSYLITLFQQMMTIH